MKTVFSKNMERTAMQTTSNASVDEVTERFKRRITQTREMLADGWSIDEVIKYFILLDDWCGINAALKVKRDDS